MQLRMAAAALVPCLVGCQTYEAVPLDSEGMRAAWFARTLDDASLREFVARLDATSEEVTEFEPEDGLSLQEGRLVALVFEPELRIARLSLNRARAGAEEAGRWTDPVLSVTALHIDESIPDDWALLSGLGFSIPLSGRLSAARALADAEQRAEWRRVLEAEWEVELDVRQAWARWSAALLRAEVTQDFLDSLEPLLAGVDEMAEAGELARPEAALFTLERAQRRIELQRRLGDAIAAEQVLRSELGLAPEAPVEFVPSLDATVDPPAGIAIDDDHPLLARRREEYEVAESALRQQIALQLPDLTFGPQFEEDGGQTRFGFLSALPLPVFNANRRSIAEARMQREVARASFDAARQALVGRYAAARARALALAQQRMDVERVIVPLVDDQVQDAMNLVRLGEGSSLVLLESLSRALETRLGLIEVRLAESLADAELEYLSGPPTHRRGEMP